MEYIGHKHVVVGHILVLMRRKIRPNPTKGVGGLKRQLDSIISKHYDM